MKELSLQDQIIEKLVNLSKKVLEHGRSNEVDELVVNGLFITSHMNKYANEAIIEFIKKLDDKVNKFNPGCEFCSIKCHQYDCFSMSNMLAEDGDSTKYKLLILDTIKVMSSYAYNSKKDDQELIEFFYESLEIVSRRLPNGKLYEHANKTKKMNLKYIKRTHTK